MDAVYRVVEEVDILTRHVSWFAQTGARVAPSLAGSRLLQAELGTLKAAADEFARQRDVSSNAINDAMQGLLAHLGAQTMDPIEVAGQGACLDAGGNAYA